MEWTSEEKTRVVLFLNVLEFAFNTEEVVKKYLSLERRTHLSRAGKYIYEINQS